MPWSRRRAIQSATLALLGAAVPEPLRSSAQIGAGEKGLAALAEPHGMKVGIQCGSGRFSEPILGPFLRANFDLFTAPLKWTSLRPGPQVYDSTEANRQFADAFRLGIGIHGHNLCWNTSNPTWFDGVLTKQNARNYLVDHINTVVRRYKGRVDSWDVVNEPIAVWQHRPDGLRTGPWLDLIGPEYLDIAFHTTLDADPSALRTLNLNGCEDQAGTGQATRDASLALIKSLLRRGVPIQAVAVEAHIDAPWKPQDSA